MLRALSLLLLASTFSSAACLSARAGARPYLRSVASPLRSSCKPVARGRRPQCLLATSEGRLAKSLEDGPLEPEDGLAPPEFSFRRCLFFALNPAALLPFAMLLAYFLKVPLLGSQFSAGGLRAAASRGSLLALPRECRAPAPCPAPPHETHLRCPSRRPRGTWRRRVCYGATMTPSLFFIAQPPGALRHCEAVAD